jgi:hypothetical protein
VDVEFTITSKDLGRAGRMATSTWRIFRWHLLVGGVYGVVLGVTRGREGIDDAIVYGLGAAVVLWVLGLLLVTPLMAWQIRAEPGVVGSMRVRAREGRLEWILPTGHRVFGPGDIGAVLEDRRLLCVYDKRWFGLPIPKSEIADAEVMTIRVVARALAAAERGSGPTTDPEQWVDRYVAAWESNHAGDIGALFTPDARYYPAPFREPWMGHDEIVAQWMAVGDRPGTWNFEYSLDGESGSVAYVRGRTVYADPPVAYSNLWRITLEPDGRCSEFVEWWMDEGGAP